MYKNLNNAQRELAEYMSHLSEEAYYASWMKDLEFDLWDALEGKLRSYGRLTFNQEIISNLKRLSQASNGWIFFDEQEEENAVTFLEWEKIRAKKNN